MDSYISPD